MYFGFKKVEKIINIYNETHEKVMSDFTPIVLFRLKIKYDMKNKKHAFFIKTIFITQ